MQPGFYRVKVYKLNESGGWDDKGTGLVSIGPLEVGFDDKETALVSSGPLEASTSSLGLVVLAEDSHKTLLAHRICTDDDIYHRQDETIITWSDVDVGTDVALSFQEANGCHAIWTRIAQLQNEDGRPGVRRRMVDEFESGPQPMDREYADAAEGGVQGAIDLPPAEMGRLEEIANALAHVPPMQRERVAQQLIAPGYLRQLLDLFRQAEDLEDASSLTALYQVLRSAVLLNDTALLEELLREEHVMDVMGALEYDPETPAAARAQHRKFLKEAVVFKQVVPIDNQETLAKIHQTYRIQYLKDVVLPRCLDDATYATLTSLMLFNNVDVLSALQADPRFLPRLFGALKDARPEAPEWGDLVAFLQELCSLSKHLQLTQRQALWSKMQQLGLFEVLTKVIASGAPAVKLRATDILLSTLGHDPLPLRNFLTRQPGHELFGLLVKEMLGAQDDSGLPEQIAELLKLLVDPETMEGAPEKSEFLEVFYERYMDVLVASVSGDREIGSVSARKQQQQQQAAVAASSSGTAATAAVTGTGDAQQQQQQAEQKTLGASGDQQQQQGGGAPGAGATAAAAAGSSRSGAGASTSGSSDPSSLLPPGPVPASTIGLIVDLLCYCVQHHQFRAKYHVLRKNVVEKVLKLLRRRERWLVVAGVRFLRTCIGTKDDFYMRYLVRTNLMEPLMTVFFENGARYNLLNSAVLELVEFVRKENIKELLSWLVQNFGSRFDEVDYVDTFKQVRIKYEQAMEKAEAAAAASEVPSGAEAAAAGTAGAPGRIHGARQRWRRDDRDMDRDEEDYFSSEGDETEEGGATAAAAAAAGAGAMAGQQRQAITFVPGVPSAGLDAVVAAGKGGVAGPSSPLQQRLQQQQLQQLQQLQQQHHVGAIAIGMAPGIGSPVGQQQQQQQLQAQHGRSPGGPGALVPGHSSPGTGRGGIGGSPRGAPGWEAGGSGVGQEPTNWLSSLAQYGDDEEPEDQQVVPRVPQQQHHEHLHPQHQQPVSQQMLANHGEPLLQQQHHHQHHHHQQQQHFATQGQGSGGSSLAVAAAAAAVGERLGEHQPLKRVPEGNGLSRGSVHNSKRPKLQEQMQGTEDAACAAAAADAPP